MERNSPNNPRGTKANSLLCPSCCVEYVEVEFDLEIDGAILHNMKALRCPSCLDEAFSITQLDAIRKRIEV